MNYNYRYRLYPTDDQREALAWTLDTCRQVYNHFLNRLNEADDVPSEYAQKNTLPDLKREWSDLKQIHSKVLQVVVERLYNNLRTLSGQKENGYNVGALRWKGAGWYKSFTYSQSGFKLIGTDTRRDRLRLSKIGEIPIAYHREIPENATIKQVCIKRNASGKWYATFGIEIDEQPEKPAPETIDPEDAVGIDVGILKYAHDTDGTAVESLDLSDERERLRREQRKLSRKEKRSNNYEKQRMVVARWHDQIANKRRDFLHKLAHYYVETYDVVAVEDLNVRGMMEQDRNSRNTAHSAWRTFIEILRYKAESAGTHLVEVNPRGTTKECSNCGVETEKPLWVREHSCPSCGYEDDRDANAAKNILQRAFSELGMGQAESAPLETATATDTRVVSASRVIERGSPALNERGRQTERSRTG
ncbi:transposase, IS605 OrfB family [Halorhabdus utahensis DSM 12940]|uniref:Transposase, IS605 OrfB family n=1 Tax=Halorhabdus utahensis (strain DSM 12940 / JCM 11049 / AX-2) TaxID=519442 RepID=C7NUL2_HALUD|nr:RNA-guided endonuclease TnpB family protein [Halorhabdus utahensis]ACV12369.1 transposase, IS605 OrfB family [Halorhabdus utahensis DSM 12940]